MIKGPTPSTWILLDSQSILNLFKNINLLTGIMMVANQFNVYTYTGMKSTKQVGHHPLFKVDAWFDPHVTANIISLAIVTKNYPMSFDRMEFFFHRPPSGPGNHIQAT